MWGGSSADGCSLAFSLLPFQVFCLYCFTHCPGFSPSCNKRHLLCLTLTVQVMGSASAASTGSFTSRWAASPAPVQLGGPACLSFLFRSCHSCRHRYSNAFESVNIEISLRYGFRSLLREVLLFSHITGAAPGPSCCWQLGTAAQGLAAASLQDCSWPPAPGSWSPLLCLGLFLLCPLPFLICLALCSLSCLLSCFYNLSAKFIFKLLLFNQHNSIYWKKRSPSYMSSQAQPAFSLVFVYCSHD